MDELPAGIPTWDVADRMRKGLREAAIGIQDMADYLGVTRNTVGTWINGRNQPSTQTLRLWALRTGVSYEWLAKGGADHHVAAARALSDPTLNKTGSSRYGALVVRMRLPQDAHCAIRDAA